MTLKLVSAAALCVALAACASNPKQDPGRFGFMNGCWQSADGVNKEVWSYPEGGISFGYATTTRDGAVTTWEQSRIDQRTARATYTASPEGQRPVTFIEAPQPMASASGAVMSQNTVTFENGDHDYPQRIQYRQTEQGLAATISKLDGSRPVDYAWARCK
jgi:hypothetical protein